MAHAGEEGPAGCVREALDEFGVERIDHGVRAMEEPDVVARLRRERIPLTVCLLSNIRLKVFDGIAAQPIEAMREAGLFVTVNSDGPAYCRSYVNGNYRALRDTFELGERELAELAWNSFEAPFLDESKKQGYLDEVDA